MSEAQLFGEVSRLRLDEGLSAAAITARLGGRATLTTVRAYVRRAIKAEVAAGRQVKLLVETPPSTRPISPLHNHVGARLLSWRFNVQPKRDGCAALTAAEFTAKFGIGNQLSLRQMEHGQHDFSLAELQRIAEVMGITLVELMTLPVR